MKTRVCSECEKRKKLDEFARDKNRPLGRCYICRPCNVLRSRTWYKNNKAKALANGQRWRENNREKQRASSRKYYKNNAERIRAKNRVKHNTPRGRARARREHLWRSFKMTPEQWDEMFTAQGSKCGCCGTREPASKRGWHTDHDHKTKRVRGIVCHACNVMIGAARDSIEILEAGKRYLSKC